MRIPKYYWFHCKNVIYPLFVSKYTYKNINEIPQLSYSQLNFSLDRYTSRHMFPLLHHFWNICALIKRDYLRISVRHEHRKSLKKKLIAYFSFRFGFIHLLHVLEYFIFVGFGSILNNPFRLKKQSGFYAQIFLSKCHYLLYPNFFLEKTYSDLVFNNQPLNIQLYFFFKRNKYLLLREKWNFLRLLNIPITVK